MMAYSSRRSACARCHELKSRCRTAAGSGSCERCCRLGLVCQQSASRRGRTPDSLQIPASAGAVAHLNHAHFPPGISPAYYATAQGPREEQQQRLADVYHHGHPSRRWSMGGQTPATLPCSPEQMYWAHAGSRPQDSFDGDSAMHLYAPSVSIIQPHAPRDGHSSDRVRADFMGEPLAPSCDAQLALALMTPDMTTSPTPPRDDDNNINTTTRRLSTETTGLASSKTMSPSEPEASGISGNNNNSNNDISQELLALQMRLCAPDASAMTMSGRLERLFRETETLLSLLSRHVASDQFRESSQSRGCFDDKNHPGSGSARRRSVTTTTSSTLPNRNDSDAAKDTQASSPASEPSTVRHQDPMTVPVLAFVFLTCYLGLLQQYNSILESLETCLVGSPEPDRARGGDSHNGCSGLGRFRLFDSMHLNASYLVPLIGRMIRRMHTFLEEELGPRAAEYERANSGGGGGVNAQGRPPRLGSMPQIAGFAVQYTLGMYRKVLNRVLSAEQALVM